MSNNFTKYLFCYFIGNKPKEERIHFAVSDDGYNFTALNNNEPVIIQTKGQMCCVTLIFSVMKMECSI